MQIIVQNKVNFIGFKKVIRSVLLFIGMLLENDVTLVY